MVDLTTKVGDLVFKNPVTVASGTFGVKDEYAPYFDYSLLGGVITKTVTVKPRIGNPMPRICETASGMLNAIGLQNKGVDAFFKEVIPYFKGVKTNLIVNVAGKSAEEFVDAAKPFAEEPTVKALELNLSCPNVSGGLDFSKSVLEAQKVIRAVRSITKKPLFAKLTPEAENFLKMAAQKYDFSARSYMRLIKVARTIADLSAQDAILPVHMAEALQYKQLT